MEKRFYQLIAQESPDHSKQAIPISVLIITIICSVTEMVVYVKTENPSNHCMYPM